MNTKTQTMFMIGIALLVMSGILIYVSLSTPGVYKESETTATQISSLTETAANSAKSAGSASKSSDNSATAVSYPINLNTATVEELTSIDGLGESRASAIIEYRDYLGGYTSVEQIKEISGIGDATYAKLAPYLTV
ncbi:helix-hairpin-helix domain-containing protein [uncultured Eubacterium sp.]|uniref:ComEA family DNA-binding protein n=1 Tax=uncultured Eubacterium sp. TaxID=165185 RepID=UPI0025DFBC85|nr:helix-hairpin-helix domain-containing protein [uncultured Eubacterium sp.]